MKKSNSTKILLVPISLDAFHTDGKAKLAAPLADFTKLPYHSYDPPSTDVQIVKPSARALSQPPPPPLPGSGVNGKNTFLSSTVFRSPNPDYSGSNDTWMPPAGLHLHWALPDALTTQRKDPKSGDKLRFPQLPNRWVVILSTKKGSSWKQENAWVVESDYLHADPKANPQPCGKNAISFPIAPPEAFQQLLETAVSPSKDDPTQKELNKYPFFYQAPFRCMGRKEVFSKWKTDTAKHEYLTQYNPAGLTAIGYGHPLFAAIYSNCFSVFGFHDDLSTTGYPRRYEVIGWYDDAKSDCLSLFQNLPAGTSPWKALKAEYNWTVDKKSDDLPTQSVYYARLELDTALSCKLPSAKSTLTVGNTATEALSAYLSQELESGASDQVIVEEQLEAMNLHPQLGIENIDLEAKFNEARHDKGFKKIYGGSLWSVRVKNTSSSADKPTQDQNAEVTLPFGLAHLLNNVNFLQAAYDASWDNMDSLRRRAFTDWYRLEYQRVNPPDAAKLPKMNDILTYSQNSVLLPMQERASATGEIAFTTDEHGRAKVSVIDDGKQYEVTVQYTIAQQLVDALDELRQQLGFYNAGKVAKNAKLEYYLVRKGAPRFYEPTDPAVLLDGEALVKGQRHDADGILNCGLCTVTESNNSLSESLRKNGLSTGAFSTIRSTIETQIQNNGLGNNNQKKQPWNPISLVWSAQVWPEKRKTKTGVSGEGIQYDADFIGGTYELDVNAADLRIKEKPSQLAKQETPYDYTGRAVLVSHAPNRLQNAIGGYLMPLSLLDIKLGGLRDQTINAETDYHYDKELFTWTHTIFAVPLPPFLSHLKDPSHLKPKELTQQQNEVASWMSRQFPFVKGVKEEKELIDLVKLVSKHKNWSSGRPVIVDHAKLGKFSSLSTSEQAKDPLHTAVRAYTKLTGKSILSQALSGFNDALLTQEREFQLPVWDWRVMQKPFKDQKAYARALVRNLKGVHTAPVFDGAFLPIRSGIMKIGGLTLVDSFGQVLKLDYGKPDATKKSERMTILNNVAASVSDSSSIATTDENKEYIYLPPRFAQEARLNFRWLAANKGTALGVGDEQEMNDHPATTPVCGWVLPNNLDGSLTIYSGSGTALGSLVQSNEGSHFSIIWESAPGTNNYTPLAKLPNPHLFDFVSNIIKWSKGSQKTWQDFLSNINKALQNIDPKSFAQHPALSLLIGRPMALVRTSLGLQTRGFPDVDHTVEAFNYDQKHNRFNRLTNGFDEVMMPVRLGEAKQLNDGLVAFWIEDGKGGYQTGTDGPAHFPELGKIGSVADTISLSLSGEALKLTMLVDPRGTVHATCGILPVKEINIPPDQYAKVLRTLSVTFLTSPVITPRQSIKYPLPAEAGYGWSWLDRPTGFTWNRVTEVKNTSREASYEQQRILEGWLKLTPQTKKDIS